MSNHAAFRTDLNARLADLLGRAARITGDLQPAEALPGDSEEQASALENDEVLNRLDEATRAEIIAVRGALRRMDAGTWGTCDHCGGEIGAARLHALPTTTRCIDCA